MCQCRRQDSSFDFVRYARHAIRLEHAQRGDGTSPSQSAPADRFDVREPILRGGAVVQARSTIGRKTHRGKAWMFDHLAITDRTAPVGFPLCEMSMLAKVVIGKGC
jgi:hypothetical protein